MKKNHLSRKISVLIISLLISIFGMLGGYLYSEVKEKMVFSINTNVEQRIQILTNSISAREEIRIRNLQKELYSVFNILNEELYIGKDTTNIEIETNNIVSQSLRLTTVPDLLADEQSVYGNTDLLHLINRYTQLYFAIYSRSEEGYVVILSNYGTPKGGSLTNVLLPHSMPLVKYTESNEKYSGRILLNEKWYKSFSISLNDGSENIGMLQMLIEEREIDFLETLFEEQQLSNTDNLFLLDTNGEYIVSRSSSGNVMIPASEIKKIIDKKNELINIDWSEDDKYKNKVVTMAYFAPYKSYIGIISDKNDLYGSITAIKYIFLICFVVATLIMYFAIILISRPIMSALSKIVDTISIMSKGKIANKINLKRSDEIGKVIVSTNKLIEGLSQAIIFSKEIKKGNYDALYQTMSENDDLGNSLLEMRANLQRAKKEDEKRKSEEKHRSWITNGQALFSTVLRQSSADNHNELYNNITDNFIKYMEANQGALYLINTDDQEKTYIELVSCIAYDRQKIVKKRFALRESLVGRCIDERATLYMTDLPDDYINITSGLGKAKPDTLLIVPLIINDQIFGAIELATFNRIEKYKVEFAEKIAESIASTLSTTKINLRTKKLLEISQEQTETMATQEEQNRQQIENLIVVQEEAEKKENIANSFLNTVNHTMIRADFTLDGKLEYANTRFLELIGFSSKDAKNTHFSTFISKEQKTKLIEVFEKIATGEPHYEGEIEFIGGDSKTYVFSTLTAIRNKVGYTFKILLLGIDMTERKHIATQEQINQQQLISNLETEIDTMYQIWNEQLNNCELIITN